MKRLICILFAITSLNVVGQTSFNEWLTTVPTLEDAPEMGFRGSVPIPDDIVNEHLWQTQNTAYYRMGIKYHFLAEGIWRTNDVQLLFFSRVGGSSVENYCGLIDSTGYVKVLLLHEQGKQYAHVDRFSINDSSVEINMWWEQELRHDIFRRFSFINPFDVIYSTEERDSQYGAGWQGAERELITDSISYDDWLAKIPRIDKLPRNPQQLIELKLPYIQIPDYIFLNHIWQDQTTALYQMGYDLILSAHGIWTNNGHDYLIYSRREWIYFFEYYIAKIENNQYPQQLLMFETGYFYNVTNFNCDDRTITTYMYGSKELPTTNVMQYSLDNPFSLVSHQTEDTEFNGLLPIGGAVYDGWF